MCGLRGRYSNNDDKIHFLRIGKVAEWFNATVLKTVVGLSFTVSSNLTLSAGEVPEWTNGAAC